MATFPISPTENIVLPCPRCQSKNRILLKHAVEHADNLRCGHCQASLLASKETALTQLSGRDYQHPLDKKSLKTLESIPGMSTVIKKLVEVTIERYQQLFNQSSFLRVSPGQLPSLLTLFEKAASSLGLKDIPELYVYQSPEVNAYTGGVENSYVAISSSLCDVMTENELLAIFGHELAHFQSKHVLFKTAARFFTFAAAEFTKYTLGIGNLLMFPLQMALLTWDRCSELSADRGMALCTKDPILSLQVLLKLSFASARMNPQLSLEHFMKQAFSSWKKSDESILDRVYTLLQTASQSHPFPLWRAAELWTWVCEGEYFDLLQKNARPFP